MVCVSHRRRIDYRHIENFAASGGRYLGIRRPCMQQHASQSAINRASTMGEHEVEERTSLRERERTRWLAIFRVHSVAKPQLTALLGSYSSSRPLSHPPPSHLRVLFRFLLPSYYNFSSSSSDPLSPRDAVWFPSRPVAITWSFLFPLVFFFIVSHTCAHARSRSLLSFLNSFASFFAVFPYPGCAAVSLLLFRLYLLQRVSQTSTFPARS